MHLAALSNDPLGDLNPDATYRHQSPRPRRASPALAKQAGVERFLFSSSCSLYGAAGDDFLDENAAFNPVTPYGESKVLVERDIASWPTTTSARPILRNATAYGVSPRLRGDLVVNNLAGYAFTTGEVLHQERRHPVAPARAHRGHQPRLPGHRSTRRASSCTTRRSTSAAPARTTRSATWRRSSSEVVPGSRGRRSPKAPAPTCATTASTATSSPRRCPSFEPQWTVRKRRRGALRGLPAPSAWTIEDLPVAPLHAHRSTSASCWTRAIARRQLRRVEASVASAATVAGGAAVMRPSSAAAPAGPVALEMFLSLGMTAAADALVRPARPRRTEDAVPAGRRVLPRAARSCRSCEEVPPEQAVRRELPVLLVVLRRPARALRASTREGLIETRGLGPAASWSRSPATTATCSSNFVERGVPVLGVEPAPDAGGRGDAEGVPTLHGVLRRRARRPARRRGQARRRDHRQQRDGPRARPERLRRGPARSCWPTTAWSRSRTPTCSDLIDHCEFDTIYHEHHCYFSCTAVDALDAPPRAVPQRRRALPEASRRHAALAHRRARTSAVGGARFSTPSVSAGLTSFDVLRAIRRARRPRSAPGCSRCSRAQGRGQDDRRLRRRGQGRARCSTSRASTPSLIDFVVDRNVHKQGLHMPGHAPADLRPVETLLEDQPDYVLLLAWNFRDEIMRQQAEYIDARRPVHRPGPGAADPVSAIEAAGATAGRPCPTLPGLRVAVSSSSTRSSRIPVHSCPPRSTTPRGAGVSDAVTCDSASAAACGFITNTAFDAALQEYGVALRGEAGLLARRSTRSRRTWPRWVERYDLRGKKVAGDRVRQGRVPRRHDARRCQPRPRHRSRSCCAERLDPRLADRISFVKRAYTASAYAATDRTTRSCAGTRSSTSGRRATSCDIDQPHRSAAAPIRRCCSSCPTSAGCCARSRSGTSTTSTARISRPVRSRACIAVRGSTSLDLELDFDDQYILIEGAAGDRPTEPAASDRGGARSKLPTTCGTSCAVSRPPARDGKTVSPGTW